TDEANNVVMAKLEELNKQLTAAEANRILKQAVWQLAKTGDPELISGMAGSSLVGAGSAVTPNSLALLQNLRSQQADLKVQYAQATKKYGAAYPKLIQMKNQMTDLENTIQEELEKIRARAENDYVAAEQAESMLRSSFDQQKNEANKLNDSAIQ